MYNPFSINGKTVLITGAASGMGKATAVSCSRMGANVICADLNASGLKSLAEELELGNHMFYQIDLSNEGSWQAMVDEIPCIDGMANCAGIAYMKPFSFVDRSDFDKVFGVNFFGPSLLTRTLIKKKKLRKGSSVVFVSSVDGPRIVHAGNSLYSASKSALVGLARNMAVDLAPKQVRVNCVLPGTTDTPLIRTANVSEEQLAENAQQFPLKRFGKPEDMANAIIFLLSDASSFITGTELVVDGGYTLV